MTASDPWRHAGQLRWVVLTQPIRPGTANAPIRGSRWIQNLYISGYCQCRKAPFAISRHDAGDCSGYCGGYPSRWACTA